MGVPVGFILGYVALMNGMKANDLFANALANKLRHFKNKWVIYVGTMLVAVIVKWVGNNQVGTTLLLIATIYPVLISLGTSRLTAISAITCCAGIGVGPATPIIPMMFGYAEMEVSPVYYFLHYELIYILPVLVVMIALFVITTPMWDKREAAQGKNYSGVDVEDQGDVDLKQYGIPMWYAVLPLFPLVLCILFGGTIFPSVSYDISSVYGFCLTVVVILEWIRLRKVKSAVETLLMFCKGFGNSVADIYPFVIAGSLFSKALSTMGGITLLLDSISISAESSIGIFIIIAYVFGFILTFLGGMAASNFPMWAMLGQYCLATGAPAFTVFSTYFPAMSLANTLSITAQGTLVAAASSEVPITAIAKRNFIPLMGGFIVLLIFSIVLF